MCHHWIDASFFYDKTKDFPIQWIEELNILLILFFFVVIKKKEEEWILKYTTRIKSWLSWGQVAKKQSTLTLLYHSMYTAAQKEVSYCIFLSFKSQ